MLKRAEKHSKNQAATHNMIVVTSCSIHSRIPPSNHLNVVLALQAYSELRVGAEQACQTPRGVCSDRAVSTVYFSDAPLLHPGQLGNFITSKHHRFNEVMQQHFAIIYHR